MIKKLSLLALLLSLLTGCGGTTSEVMLLTMTNEYDGNVYQEAIGDFHVPTKTNDYDTFFDAINHSIKHERIDVGDERIRVITIYNENDELIYQNTENLKFSSRVYLFDDEKIYIWLSVWGNTNFYVGASNDGNYIDGYLKTGTLLAVDTNTGEELYNLKTNENEVFLTVNDNKAYFYHQGYTENQGMLWWEEDKNAKIFYRELDDFDTKHIVHTFNYDANMYNEPFDLEKATDVSFMENEEYAPYCQLFSIMS